jgi:hypothetical protein
MVSTHILRHKDLVGEKCFRCGHVFAVGDLVTVVHGFRKREHCKVACAKCYEAMYIDGSVNSLSIHVNLRGMSIIRLNGLVFLKQTQILQL